MSIPMANHHFPFTLTMSLIRLAAVTCLFLGTAPQLHAKTIVTRDGIYHIICSFGLL
ncbi:MAG: hypothetical protein HDS91_05365 [Bacteroidales bacterium]|nr:hypothetical protein [Bacteroidales bacterium]